MLLNEPNLLNSGLASQLTIPCAANVRGWLAVSVNRPTSKVLICTLFYLGIVKE